jgi:hypothetical protein
LLQRREFSTRKFALIFVTQDGYTVADDNDGKFTTGVIDTGGKFFTDVSDTGAVTLSARFPLIVVKI